MCAIEQSEDGDGFWLLPNRDRVHFTLRRGSIDEIRLPAAALTEELARAVWSRFPVTKCVLTNKEPWDAQLYHWGWAWMTALTAHPEQMRNRDRIPEDLFGIVHSMATHKGIAVCGFPTREVALDALSAACVRWGRSLAGLTVNQ